MKNNLLIVTVVILSSLIGCDSKVSKYSESADTTESVASALCIWKEVSIRETPSEKGRYRRTVYLGEKLLVMPDTASEKVNDRVYNYLLVELSDGTQGWIRKEFVAVNAVAAAFLQDAIVYERPDLMTSTKKNFNAMDFVAVKTNNKDGWAEVIGKRSGDSWFTTGWVKNEKLTTAPNDVMFSVLYLKAMGIADEDKRTKEVQNILMTTELMGSAFYSRINDIYGESSTDGSDESTTVETDTTSGD